MPLRWHSRDDQAGVGERARADARIILEGVKTEVYNQRTKESNYVVWQKQLNQGSRTETLTQESLTPAGAALVGFKVSMATLAQSCNFRLS